ncbi:hypothetical protein [Microbacterium sp. 69-7]|nr:hypothetical protein [Microbacterium sp. 69-7]
MSITVVYCPDCGHGFYQWNGVAASIMWADHYAKAHGAAEREQEGEKV